MSAFSCFLDRKVPFRYFKAKEILEDDSRWKEMDDNYREMIYLRYLREKRDKMREERRQHRDENISTFRKLLTKSKVKVVRSVLFFDGFWNAVDDDVSQNVLPTSRIGRL